MLIRVYRDRGCAKDYVGRIERKGSGDAAFVYDPSYLERGRAAGEYGISHRMPLDATAYTMEQFGPFFRGLLPEGEVYGNLAQMYQVARNDYLSFLERLGCESIGALTFVSEQANVEDYRPHYDALSPESVRALRENPIRAITRATSETRLSLSGAQSKIAWLLPQDVPVEHAEPTDWLVPRETAPSSHIIKVSRHGEEDVAYNELACSLIARACGIDAARVSLVPFIPGAIAVTRYDRAWVTNREEPVLTRLHQEDFCQALGLPPHLKYQVEGTPCSYMLFASDLIDAASANPARDRLEFAKRLAFNYAVGNSDAHLKNSSLLYSRTWTRRELAPLYDVTCIPLTGFSTKMAFDIGRHRELADIDEKDLLAIALDLDIGLDDFDRALREILGGFATCASTALASETGQMMQRIIENSTPRLEVIQRFMGAA